MANRRGRESEPPPEANPASQRIDKWLVFARVVKTRGIAQDLVEGRKVRLNREKIDNSARNIRLGDVLTISYSDRVHVLKVVGFAERRGSPSEAQLLYEDLSVPEEGDKPGKTGAEREESPENLFEDTGASRAKTSAARERDKRDGRKERKRRDDW